jgi:hypothetical protein
MLSLKIDDGEPKAWPRAASVKTDGLEPRASHKVVVMGSDLCLFLNDLYGTVQLQERNRSPLCRCG